MKLLRPTSVNEAVSELQRDPIGTLVYSGGLEVGFGLRRGSLRAAALLDTKRLPDMSGIRVSPAEVRIAPGSRHHAISIDESVRARIPSLALACGNVGSTRIRMQGTLGGNIGHGHQHTDPGTALVALSGSIDLIGPAGPRTVSADEFWLGPYHVARRPDELITGIRVTPLGAGWTAVHDRVEQLHRPPNAVVSLVGRVENGELLEIRIGVGGVPGRPTRLIEVEDVVRGRRLSELRSSWTDVDRAMAGEVTPENDILGTAEFKLMLLSGLLRRSFGRLARAATRGTEDGR